MDFFNSIELNSENLLHNLNVIKKQAQNKKICAMVKANAYGHSLRFVVQNLKNKVDFFGVANTEEALKVREYVYRAKILVCGYYNKEKLSTLIQKNISLTVFSLKQLNDILKTTKQINLKANVHIKLNTGMNRLGIKSIVYLKKVLSFIEKNKSYINLEGVYSHLFNSQNESLCRTQYFKFLEYLKCFKNPDCIFIHLENSAGLFNNVDFLNICNMVRVGISLYGLEIKNKNLKPVLSLKSKIVAIQKLSFDDYIGYGKINADETKKVAITPIGYADGILRNYKNAYVKISGEYCKILNVCMDMIIIDITNIKAKINDEVEIISSNIKNQNSANNLAKHLNTISYEIVSNLNHNRLNLIYK